MLFSRNLNRRAEMYVWNPSTNSGETYDDSLTFNPWKKRKIKKD